MSVPRVVVVLGWTAVVFFPFVGGIPRGSGVGGQIPPLQGQMGDCFDGGRGKAHGHGGGGGGGAGGGGAGAKDNRQFRLFDRRGADVVARFGRFGGN